MDKNREKEVLGLDIGGVIKEKEDKNIFSVDYSQAKRIDGAFEAIKKLVSNRFEERVFLVSKVKEAQNEERIRGWLSHHKFWQTMKISYKNIRFCKERSDKAGICRELGITHFVDDRIEVLHYLDGMVENLYLLNISGSIKEKHKFIQNFGIERYTIIKEKVCEVNSWDSILKKLIPESGSVILPTDKKIWRM